MTRIESKTMPADPELMAAAVRAVCALLPHPPTSDKLEVDRIQLIEEARTGGWVDVRYRFQYRCKVES